jgi:hypothetical protein
MCLYMYPDTVAKLWTYVTAALNSHATAELLNASFPMRSVSYEGKVVGGDPLRWSRDTLYPQKLAITSPTNGGR